MESETRHSRWQASVFSLTKDILRHAEYLRGEDRRLSER